MTFFLSLLVHSLAVYVVMATTAVPLPLSVIKYPRHLRSIAHRKYPYSNKQVQIHISQC